MAVSLRAVRAAVRDAGASAPDPRRQVFDVNVERRGDGFALTGESTVPEAVERALARASHAAGTEVVDEVVRLPAPGAVDAALVRAAAAPLYAAPDPDATLLTQYVLGHRMRPLSHHGRWWRVRGEDGHTGWVHEGYLLTCEDAWARAWERGDEGEPVVALDGELADEAGHIIARLAWGARLVRLTGDRYRMPDGREGVLQRGEVVATDRLADRFPARGESVARTARRWLGVPYLWGGVTMGGVDCSGFVQAVLWMHGIAMPRDSDLQARIGEAVEPGEDLRQLAIGDLLFFDEESRGISHVGIGLGGTAFIHCAMSNGGVDVNELDGDLPLETRLRDDFAMVRRILPD